MRQVPRVQELRDGAMLEGRRLLRALVAPDLHPVQMPTQCAGRTAEVQENLGQTMQVKQMRFVIHVPQCVALERLGPAQQILDLVFVHCSLSESIPFPRLGAEMLPRQIAVPVQPRLMLYRIVSIIKCNA
jgi:hypothetical protein